MPTISFKSYCWCLGTTSFRTKEFNKKIEEQLDLLEQFWNLPQNVDKNLQWEGNNALQTDYYDFLNARGFVSGEAQRPDKDAREKTSGLVALGLLDNNRHLTEVGYELLKVSRSNIFSDDNSFNISKDSYIYFCQLLKCSVEINGAIVRPFMILLIILSNMHEYNYQLTLDEFTYLLPLCISEEFTNSLLNEIRLIRNKEKTIDQVIIDRLLGMDNYKAALELFLSCHDVTQDIICEVGLNRKSRKFDEVYYLLFYLLKDIYINKDSSKIYNLWRAIQTIKNGKIKSAWSQLLFNTSNSVAIKRAPLEHFRSSLIFTENLLAEVAIATGNIAFECVTSENDLRRIFFKTMHLFKAKATLSDYMDLNRRYFSLSGIVLFEDNTVSLDVIPRYFFLGVSPFLMYDAFSRCEFLGHLCTLEEINEHLAFTSEREQDIIQGIVNQYGRTVTKLDEINGVLHDIRYARWAHLLETKFQDEKLVELLDFFYSRNDKAIYEYITDNADIPTIFEYILGIIWYKISGCRGDILSYYNLSLDANLFPITHAGGGEADIVYKYFSCPEYPEHELLIEATLSDNTNQRRMEMEPVSRHLGQRLLETHNTSTYCVFIAPDVHINVLSEFRNCKNYIYYNPYDVAQHVHGMKIIPLNISELKNVILSHKNYPELYHLFEHAFGVELHPYEWYKCSIAQSLQIGPTCSE